MLRVTTLGRSLVAGAAWGFVSFVFFWDMLLPIGRDGAPFRATATAPGLFVALEWVYFVAFMAFGLATGLFYSVLRGPKREVAEDGLDLEASSSRLSRPAGGAGNRGLRPRGDAVLRARGRGR